jgi:hypothetical protein
MIIMGTVTEVISTDPDEESDQDLEGDSPGETGKSLIRGDFRQMVPVELRVGRFADYRQEIAQMSSDCHRGEPRDQWKKPRTPRGPP